MGLVGFGILVNMVLPLPFGFIIEILLSITISVHFVEN
jgi:hypothetical protein